MKSKYVCEGQRLRLRCEGDYIIRILGAKYGRLEPGDSICPHENITDFNCRAPDVLLKMTVRCGNKRKCTVKADHTMFGDPCPGTFKYLDVIYRCSKFISVIGKQLYGSLNERAHLELSDNSRLEVYADKLCCIFLSCGSGNGLPVHFHFTLILGFLYNFRNIC